MKTIKALGETDVPVEAEGREVLGDLINVHKYPMEAEEKMETGFSQWCAVTGQEAADTTWNTGNFA